MKYLHIVSNWNYNVMIPYIEFINDNFSTEQHFFVVMDKIDNIPEKMRSQKNVKSIIFKSKFNIKELVPFLKKSENIIIHGLAFNIYQQLSLLFSKDFFNKTVWIAWGGDLYQSNNDDFFNLINKLKNTISNFIFKKFKKKIKWFVGIFPPDIKYFKRKYQTNAKTFYASYTGNLYNSFYQKNNELKTLEQKIIDRDTINIQVGHSSFDTLHHLEVLDQLVKYRDKNIKLFLPLSYGNVIYGDKIEKRAIELFGDKAVVFRKMMSKENYMEHLSNIDIAIFNTQRQIGLGNISPLLYMQKKIYIPKGTVMYDFYQSEGINICDYNEIKNLTFNEFIEPIDMKNGKKYIVNNELNKEKKIKMWSEVFKGIQKEA